MNLLIDRCPEVIELNGKEYPINSDHRTSILFETAMRDNELDDTQKLLIALNLYYEEIPEDVQAAFESIIWFYTLGKQSKLDNSANSDNSDNSVNSVDSKQSSPRRPDYSFEHDGEYVYTSFLSAYNIDLTEVDLHWWKFRTLFNNLPEDTIMKQIIDIRNTKISSKMSADEKKRIKQLRNIYKLPEVDIDDSFGDALSDLF